MRVLPDSKVTHTRLCSVLQLDCASSVMPPHHVHYCKLQRKGTGIARCLRVALCDCAMHIAHSQWTETFDKEQVTLLQAGPGKAWHLSAYALACGAHATWAELSPGVHVQPYI